MKPLMKTRPQPPPPPFPELAQCGSCDNRAATALSVIGDAETLRWVCSDHLLSYAVGERLVHLVLTDTGVPSDEGRMAEDLLSAETRLTQGVDAAARIIAGNIADRVRKDTAE